MDPFDSSKMRLILIRSRIVRGTRTKKYQFRNNVTKGRNDNVKRPLIASAEY